MPSPIRLRSITRTPAALAVAALVGACGAAVQTPSASQGLPTIGPSATASVPVVTPTPTLATLANDLAAGVTPPAQTFVVTIDDGWWDGYTYAYPILAQHGFVATFFVIAGRIWDVSFMGPGQIQALAAAGNEIGDHTVHHGRHTALNPKALISEIDSAAATIAAVTGLWPETLAYPHGATDAQVMAAVAACKPLRMAVVQDHGGTLTWADRFRVARIEVAPDRTPKNLLAYVLRVGQ